MKRLTILQPPHAVFCVLGSKYLIRLIWSILQSFTEVLFPLRLHPLYPHTPRVVGPVVCEFIGNIQIIT